MGNRAEQTHQLKEENRFRFRAPLNDKNHHQLLQPPYDIIIAANTSDDGAGQLGIPHHHKTLTFPEPYPSADTRCAATGGTKQANGLCVVKSINQKLCEYSYLSSDNAATFSATACPESSYARRRARLQSQTSPTRRRIVVVSDGCCMLAGREYFEIAVPPRASADAVGIQIRPDAPRRG